MSKYEKIELTNMCMIYDNNGNVFQAECDTILLAREYCVSHSTFTLKAIGVVLRDFLFYRSMLPSALALFMLIKVLTLSKNLFPSLIVKSLRTKNFGTFSSL